MKQPSKRKSALEVVEAQIAKQEKDLSKAERDKKAAEGRINAARIKAVKTRAFEFERKNRTKLLLFASGGNWYKMGGNSALIYKHLIAPKLGLEVKLRPDRDFYAKFLDGVVSVLDVDTLQKSLAGIGIKLEAKDKEMIVFDLGREISNAELDTFRKVDEERKSQINQIVGVKEMYPVIVSKQRRITQLLRSKMLKASPMDRDMIMTSLARESLKATVDLICVANGLKMAEQVLENTWVVNERVKIYAMQLMEMGILTIEETLRLEQELVDVNTQIKAEQKKLTKRQSSESTK